MRLEQLKVWKHHKHLVVAVIDDEPSVVAAVHRLHRLGVTNDQISLLALDTRKLYGAIDAVGPQQGRVLRPETSGDRLADETRSHGQHEVEGLAIGGCIGLVIGLGVIALPGIGPMLLAAGPVLQVINVVGHMVVGGVGMGMLLGAIFDDRVSEDARDYFKESLHAGRWLLILHGDDPLIEQATAVIPGDHVERVQAF
ncbi:hypothetical protein D3C72_696510 [compost metagenome]